MRHLRWLTWMLFGEPVQVRIWRRTLIKDFPKEIKLLLMASPGFMEEFFIDTLFHKMSDDEKAYCKWRGIQVLA